MRYHIIVTLVDDKTYDQYAIKRPHVTDNRLHIDSSTEEYTVIPMSLIKMYTVSGENHK
jgi:translation elongation factor P/translation initiation factor 5A